MQNFLEAKTIIFTGQEYMNDSQMHSSKISTHFSAFYQKPFFT